ncbi:hypothetical protein KIN20_004919 [Parelaphostrongylus tenuis]|uniref:Uncharacterized protein n=1 Tax=Parelaphostrongylus tenuis TaxID=148309 RepID=A0AAD5MS05_PARTN|nr:hypothetical protein KIN20_004919 [Parelaphostrongylus tenuis]
MVLNGFFGRISTTPSSSNASIDRVVFQVEMLSNQINVLTYNIEDAVATVKERGKQTVASLNHNLNNGTIENFERMLRIVSMKTHDWPLTALLIVGITALILVLVSFLFLLAKGGEKIAERSYKRKVLVEDHDIECL